MHSIQIENHKIGQSHPPFIIAEMSGNHNQSLKRALELVEVASNAGAHALKIQTYTADTMTLDLSKEDFLIADPNSLWVGKSLYELYQEAHTPWEWHKPIFDKAHELGLVAFSTPFDESSVEFLEELQVPCYKIASFENTDLPLIRKVASTGKPIIISTGMASVAELDETVRAAREAGAEDIILLKCTSTYPASAENSNILTIPHMRELFDCEVGISDHTLGLGVAVGAVALGATVIEKHFTINRTDGGVDSAFSLEASEMRDLVLETKNVWNALGKVSYGTTEQEVSSLKYRRSLYCSKNIQAGKCLTRNNVRAIRPGYGLPVKFFETVLGRKVKKNISAGTPLSWDLF